MRLKHLIRALLAFSPSIIYALGLKLGFIRDTYHGAGTATAMIQGLVLMPFIAWMWIDFRNQPKKYPASSWLIKFIDLFLIGFVLLAVLYAYWNK